MPDLNFLKKSVVKVQERNAFDKSFRNLLTTKCGTLTPILCDELIPNTTVNLGLAINCTLPPLASETFMNVNLKVEAFFCPTRLVFKGFEQWIQGNTTMKVGSSPAAANDSKIRMPLVKLQSDYIGPGSLADYLGFRSSITGAVDSQYLNACPFLVYELIWDTWYRNSLVQQSAFADETFYMTGNTWYPSYMRYKVPLEAPSVGYTCNISQTMRDGHRLSDLRQRNFGSDYFSIATPSPQNGPAQKITMLLPTNGSDGVHMYFDTLQSEDASLSEGSLNVSDGTAGYVTFGVPEGGESTVVDPVGLSFTIASLRACNALQVWEERNNLANNKYVDFLKVQFNADLKDSIAQRPQYLGSASFPVYSKGVYQTAADSNSGNNPFDSVGSRYGHAYAEGTSLIIDHFTCQEPGYLMVIASLVPEATYSSGINKYLTRYLEKDSYGEMANHLLQGVGPEPIYDIELIDGYGTFGPPEVFGYVDRFASWMTRYNELHGLLRDGQSLESFALQRNMYGVQLQISDSFLQIPTDFMDQVTAVDSAISNYGCWIDSWLDYKVVQPLARYSIPSLQDPAYEHGDTVVVNRRGRSIE